MCVLSHHQIDQVLPLPAPLMHAPEHESKGCRWYLEFRAMKAQAMKSNRWLDQMLLYVVSNQSHLDLDGAVSSV